MKKMRCCVVLAPVKKEARHESELHTQLLYGQVVQMQGEAEGSWTSISFPEDPHSYYVLTSHLTPFVEEGHQHILQHNAMCQLTPGPTLLFAGSLIEASLGENALFDGKFDAAFLQHFLNIYVGSPYCWGGITSAGIDCSGLTRLCYFFAGIQLPHSASLQMQLGEPVDFIQQVKIGDLAFFANEQDEIYHVGIMLSPNQIMHASAGNGVVAIDEIDQEGIMQRQSGKRSHRLRMIKRIVQSI